MIPLKDYNPTTRTAWITIALIAINVVVYFFVQPHQGAVDTEFTYDHAAIPYEVTHDRPLTPEQVCESLHPHDPQCLQFSNTRPLFPHKNVYLAILYSMFLHASLLHIGGNMLFLWIFGNNIEDRMGWIGFPLFYLASGLAAAAAHIAGQPSSTVPIVGASGAIAGVMGAYLVLFPNVRIRTLFFFIIILLRDITAKWLLLAWFLLQFFTGPNSGVAWLAHVGGFVFGALVALALRDRLRRTPAQPVWFY
jgi:membrane associated rhomboid family serine protease